MSIGKYRSALKDSPRTIILSKKGGRKGRALGFSIPDHFISLSFYLVWSYHFLI